MSHFALTDSRRLTGANLYWDLPAAIIDVEIDPETGPAAETVIDRWAGAARNLLHRVGLEAEQLTWRSFEGGASLLISAPIDALYSMCELNEAAWAMALARLGEGPEVDVEAESARLKALFEGESYPPLLALQGAAAERGVPFLWDDDEVSVGYGPTAKVWPAKAMPASDAVDWASLRAIPVGLVTGTNGKSTTVRMAAAMIRAAGLSAGLTSTDWIRVGDRILDTGDYSGPGGARALMRHPETEIAVLEVARGGLLRRGLGVERASAALITNVAADHLGEYGINTVADLAEAKFVVRRALKGDAPLILNADDENIVARAAHLEGDFAERPTDRLIWFSLVAANPVVARHAEAGGRAAWLDSGWLALAESGDERRIVRAEDIPAAMHGAARHNISNALGAMALCTVLGIGREPLQKGLTGFRGDESDNPGRANWFEHGGVRILVDFAHNEHGMNALAHMVDRMGSGRRLLLMGQAGDRSDEDIGNLTRAACAMAPDRLMICDMPGYERGRGPMEVPGLIRVAAIGAGLGAGAISIHASPPDAVKEALAGAAPGDMLILLVLAQRDEVLRLIHEFMGR